MMNIIIISISIIVVAAMAAKKMAANYRQNKEFAAEIAAANKKAAEWAAAQDGAQERAARRAERIYRHDLSLWDSNAGSVRELKDICGITADVHPIKDGNYRDVGYFTDITVNGEFFTINRRLPVLQVICKAHKIKRGLATK